jgi:hypothetical protein
VQPAASAAAALHRHVRVAPRCESVRFAGLYELRLRESEQIAVRDFGRIEGWVDVFEGSARQIVSTGTDVRGLACSAGVAERRRDHRVRRIDVRHKGNLLAVVKGAIEGLDGRHHRRRYEGVPPAGKEEHAIASQPRGVVDVSRRRSRARRGDAAPRVGMAEKWQGAEVRTDAQRSEQAFRVIVSGTEIGAAGEDRGAHHSGRMRDMKLMRHEAAGGDAGHGDARLVDTQRREGRVVRGGDVARRADKGQQGRCDWPAIPPPLAGEGGIRRASMGA